MFTGIVEAVAVIGSISPSDNGLRLVIDLGALAEGTRTGDSIAVDGMCLTVTDLSAGVARFDLSAESLRKTTAGTWKVGRRVNLERALRLGDRLGGHLVSGHVDGIGRIERVSREGESQVITFILPDDDAVKVVEKGSLTVDGVSLTVWDCRGRRCSVAAIPHTLAVTTLGEARPGRLVNLEQDLIGRWVERLVAPRDA